MQAPVAGARSGPGAPIASTSGREATAVLRFGRLKLHRERRRPDWLIFEDESYVTAPPQLQQFVRAPLLWPEGVEGLPGVGVSGAANAHAPAVPQQQHFQTQQGRHQQQQQEDLTADMNRVFTARLRTAPDGKALAALVHSGLSGELMSNIRTAAAAGDKGAVGTAAGAASAEDQHSHAAAQPPQQALSTGSGAAGATLEQQLLSPGNAACQLDSRSVVAALCVVAVRASEWQREGGAVRRSMQAALQGLCTKAGELLAAGAIAPKDLVSLLYALAKLQQREQRELARDVAAALQPELIACTPEELFRVIWAAAMLDACPGGPWLQAFCLSSASKFYAAQPQHVSMIAWGLARLGHRPPQHWLEALLEAAAARMGAASAQNVANLVWALGKWRVTPPADWQAQLWAASAALLHDFSPVGVAQLLFGLAQIGVRPPDAWLDALSMHVVGQLGDMQPLQQCNLVWSFAQWRYRPSAEFMSCFLAATAPSLPLATATDLCTLLWSLCQLGYLPTAEWLDAWLTASADRLHDYSASHFATSALVLGRWGVVPGKEYMVQFFRASSPRLAHAPPFALGRLAYGLGLMRRSVPAPWLTQLLAAFVAQMPAATPADTVRVVVGMGSVFPVPMGRAAWAQQQQGLLAQLVAAATPMLQELAPRALLQSAAGLCALGHQPGGAFLEAHAAAVAAAGERLSAEQRWHLQRMYSRLGAGGKLAGQQRAQQEKDMKVQQGVAGSTLVMHTGS